MLDFSFVANAHPEYIENLYDQYQENPEAVEQSWALFFKGFDYAGTSANGNGATTGSATGVPSDHLVKELLVLSLIKSYRNRGHLESTTNPIRQRRDRQALLRIEDFNLSEGDLDTHFFAGKEIDMKGATLREIVAHLREVYCGDIGYEYHHITNREQRRWLRNRIEASKPKNSYGHDLDKKRRILEKLNGAVVFEEFLHTKYVGQKRFSLEGGENTIVALDGIINEAAKGNVKEIVIGMAHRGRLNVLANIMGKTYESIFSEFEGTALPKQAFGDGDVKYHLGYSSQTSTPSGESVDLKLVPNPSHLEAVDPVVEGFSRAKADILYASEYDSILPILIHGDAAVAGQGVVFETVQMSGLDGYYTGGTVHFVINNQIGFTTDFDDARTSTYCTGVAGVVQAPVFHVNGDHPEAVLFACEMAIQFRQEFNSDVFIDMVCYRKHGHNEGDEPMFTQPGMYEIIQKHDNPRDFYNKILVKRGDVDAELADEMENAYKAHLQERLDEVREHDQPYTYQEPEEAWRRLRKTTDPADFLQSPETGIDSEMIHKIIDHLQAIPKDFTPLSKVKRLIKGKQKLLDDQLIDWSYGELMAYASILLEGKDVRMSGQDVKRGTFSHRHAIFHDAKTYQPYNRLNALADSQGVFRIFNSLLSEFAVLGFEYGYSLATPDALVIWEAQFGDFANGAQTMIDQFITAGESKWQRMSGLVMLLPHGYEGQGPEHSSARLERFLQASAEFNITVAYCTTPANFFHLLRRQLARPFRKPLVHMAPKSVLRHPEAVSKIDDFASGTRFQEVIDDASINKTDAKKVKRLLFCSGKVYYDLLAYQRENKRKDVAIVRLEQLYPFPDKQLQDIQKKYAKAEKIWVQEEPANMGAWWFIHALAHKPDPEFQIDGHIARKPSASPATGFKKIHDQQQQDLVEKAFAV